MLRILNRTAAALAVFVGHLWPVFFRFQGGKGVATAAGILLALGWEPKRVRRVLFREGFTLAVIGTLLPPDWSGAAIPLFYMGQAGISINVVLMVLNLLPLPPLGRNSAPVTWGGVGTDAQHAVFQLLHQGTHLIPVEFIASKTPGHDYDTAHHETLLVNCFAQGAALMAGQKSDDLARNYAGNRPSTTILMDDVTPSALGALIAFYEHRTFVNAVLLGINPFDQFGVELGKQIAKSIGENGARGFDPSTTALIAAALGDN